MIYDLIIQLMEYLSSLGRCSYHPPNLGVVTYVGKTYDMWLIVSFVVETFASADWPAV